MTTIDELGLDSRKPLVEQLRKHDQALAAERELAAQKERLAQEQRSREEAAARSAAEAARWTKPTRLTATCSNCGTESILAADSVARRNELALALSFDVLAGNILHYKCACGARNTVILGEVFRGSPASFPGVRGLLAQISELKKPIGTPLTPPMREVYLPGEEATQFI